MGVRRVPDGWSSIERRNRDGTIESEQRATAVAPPVEHSEAGAALLGASYWRAVTRASAGLVHCITTDDAVTLRLLHRGPRLLVLGPVELAVDGDEVAWRARIRGGLLVRRRGGTFSLVQRGVVLAVRVEDFVPRLGRLYAALLRRFHLAVSRRYLRAWATGGRR